MEFIKEILKEYEIPGEDIEKISQKVNEEFPKHAVPKTTFNEKIDDLKTANALIKDLKKSNEDADELQKTIDDYESKLADLTEQREKEIKDQKIKDALITSGAEDVDYLIWKLGEVETNEDGELVDIENKIKDLKETQAKHFKAEADPKDKDQDKDEDDPEEPAGFKFDDKGYKILENNLEDGQDEDPNTSISKAFEKGLGL